MSAILQNKQLVGWIQAFVAVLFFLGLNNVYGRYSAFVLEIHPVIYSCSAFASCALTLLFISGSGPLAKESMRSIDTWIYGVILMMSYIIGMMLFAYVTSSEGTMLQKVCVSMGLLGSWFFLGRTPDIYQLVGTLVITIGVVLVALGLDGSDTGIILLLALLYGAFQAARIFAAELHRPHKKAAEGQDPKAKARVVGFVMFVVSLIFLAGTFLVALAQMAQSENVIKGLPVMSDFLHTPSVFAGMISGVLIVAPLRILEFSASHTIKAENFATVTALSFVSTIFWEWAVSPFTALTIKDISSTDLFAGGLITAGGLFIALTRGLRGRKQFWQEYLYRNAQDLDAIDDSRDILANTLEHFDGGLHKTAEALEIPYAVLEKLLNDPDKVLAFKPSVLKDVTRRYRKKVAMCDSLTGLANRAGFMTALKGAPYETETYAILYIDLDRFKPVNDTYGHDAGDAVLKGVAIRLKEMFKNHAVVTRLGGDEFCVLALDADKSQAEAHAQAIKAKIAEPFEFDGKSIEIGASVGIACAPEDGTEAEALMKLADGGMYEGKTGTSR